MRDELSPSEAARRLRTTTRSVQRWIALGRLPARRVGGRWRVASVALDAFAAQGTSPASGVMHPHASRDAKAFEEGAPRKPSRHTRRLFVANRGEIARRIRRTAERLGIVVIEPITDGPTALDLLDVASVVAAASTAGADALHPGFGFLAENASFAEAVEAAGIAWVGPPPSAIRAMGDKATARRLAVELGVPVVPGYDDADQSDGALTRAAKKIGFPLLVKPAAGGGGKGMRTVRDPAALADSLGSARREAVAAFDDDRLILERFIEGPRHVEVQVLFDAHGEGIHLGERDCSTQRRHQKILEETPSPAVTPAIRERLTAYALQLAGAVGYRSAGTCEFLLGERDEVFFLEMNTRLQVEHPVTEAVTGLDLVEEQLRIAEGRPLAIAQGDVDASLAGGGHAIEVRLYAEDAEDDFLPATGRVVRLRWPRGEGIRIDAGIEEGSIVGSRFDPMLAKVIAHGSDRAAALDRLTRALDETIVLGLTTNLRFLRWLVRQPAVREGEMRIDTLARVWPPDDWTARAALPELAWQAAARALAGAGGIAGDGGIGGWRLNGPPRIRLATEAGERMVAIHAGAPRAASVVVTGDVAHVDVVGRSVPFRLAAAPDVDRAARAAVGSHGGGPVEVVAPMPGSILAVHATVGQAVDAADPIVTLEAMKMEHGVATPIGGSVSELRARPGDQVARGDVLAVVEP
ncbi:MAG TPA: biotin carboxylase N-terminal domain-containing protein [Candidatus Limnocylindria bacterium]|nr:biotin carboxylase N-terminal domain-containing protein [Candidatus Limnocylindria bacterium]